MTKEECEINLLVFHPSHGYGRITSDMFMSELVYVLFDSGSRGFFDCADLKLAVDVRVDKFIADYRRHFAEYLEGMRSIEDKDSRQATPIQVTVATQQQLDNIAESVQVGIGSRVRCTQQLIPEDYRARPGDEGTITGYSKNVGAQVKFDAGFEEILLTTELDVIDYRDYAEGDLNSVNMSGPVCECGSERCGSPIHSTWCPKFTPY